MTQGRYTHGHHQSVLRSHLWRTAENSAGFLLARLAPDAHVLDVGCGPGNITADLARRVPDGRVLGIDASPEVIERARGTADLPANVTFAVDDVYHLGLEDESFDVVYVHQVLQHLHDPVSALGEIRRVLRPGGVLAARDADFGGMFWHPRVEALEDWMTVYHHVTAANGAQADGGRHLPAWVHAAGFEEITVTSSTWTYATADEREWWGGLWAERVVASEFARQAREGGVASEHELSAMADGFRDWAASPDGLFVVPSVEVLARSHQP